MQFIFTMAGKIRLDRLTRNIIMTQIVLILWCLLVGQPLFSAAESAAKRQLSRLDLIRAANATATKDIPIKQKDMNMPAAGFSIVRKKGRPPVPTMPGKPIDLTDDQKKTYDLLATYAPQLKDPAQYADTAKKLRSLIDGKLIGTDPRKIIKQRPELQHALLAATLNGLSKQDLITARQNNKINDEQLNTAVEEGRKLNLTLNVEQWVNLELPQNQELKDQYLNANDLLATFTDQPLSSADSALLEDFVEKEKKVSSPAILFAGSAATTAAITALVAAWKKIKEKKLAEKNSATAEAVKESADLNIIDESAISADQKKDLVEMLQDTPRLNGNSNPESVALLDKKTRETILDITDTEDPDSELNHLVEDLIKVLNDEAIKVPTAEIINGFLKKSLNRMQVLISKLVAASTSGGINQQLMQKLVASFAALPEEFFVNIKALLTAQTLNPNDRDTFVTAATSLLKALEVNAPFLGITESTKISSAATKFHDLSLGLESEIRAYSILINDLPEIKVLLLQMTVDFNVAPIKFKEMPTKQPSGDPMTIADIDTRHEKDISEIKKLKSTELFSQLMPRLLNGLTTNKAAIINNPKLFNLFLGSSSLMLEEIPQRIRIRLNPTDQNVIKQFFALKADVEQQVTAKTGLLFSSNAEPEGTEKEILLSLYALYNALYVSRSAQPLVVKPKVVSSNDTLEELVIALQNLLKLALKAVPAQPTAARNELQNTFVESVAVRTELYGKLSIPSDFFSQATAMLKNNKNKFELSEYGSALCTTLLTIEGSNTEYTQLLTQISSNFKAISFDEKQKPIMEKLKVYVEAIVTAVTKLKGPKDDGSGRLAGEAAVPFVADYKNNVMGLLTLLNNEETTISIIFNAFTYQIVFPNDDFFLNDIPEMADAEALKATQVVLKIMQALVRNISDTNPLRAPHKPRIQITLDRLIKDAEGCELSAADQLTGQAQAIYILLTNSFVKFNKRETYLDGLMNVYAVVQDQKNRKLISAKDNNIIYTTVFSPKGIFCLPDDVNLEKPADAKLDSLTIEAGFLLYECLKKNPNDLGINDDDLSKAFVSKFANFFKQLKMPTTATGAGAPATAEAAAAAVTVKQSTDALAQSAKDNPDEAAANQMIKYIKDNASALSDKKRIGDFVRDIYKQLSSSSKRKIVGRNQALKNLLFSPDGLLIAPTTLPSFIKLKDLDDVIKLYKTLKSHPNDLGIALEKGESTTLDKTSNGLDAILANLKKRDDIASDEKQTYEDIDSYEFENDDTSGAKKSRGYKTLTGMVLTGSIGTLQQVVGPKITAQSLADNEWALKQIDLYNYLYSDAFVAMRSPFMEKLIGCINVINKMVTDIDQDETFVIRASFSDMRTLRRVLNKKPLEDAFKATVLDIKYLPKNITEADFQQERITLKKFYEMLKENLRKFEMRAGDEGKIKTILGWIAAPDKAPTVEQETLMNGGIDLSGTNSGMYLGMNGTLGGLNMIGMNAIANTGGPTKKGAPSASDMLGLNKTGGMNMGMGMNPMMMGMGMNPMMMGMNGMGMNGMTINPMMMTGMPGMMGMNGMGMMGMGMMGMQQQQTALTKEDIQKAITEQKNQDLLQELKTRALVQDMFGKTTPSGIAFNSDLAASLALKTDTPPDPEPTPTVSDEELQKYKEARKTQYQQLKYKLGGSIDSNLQTILRLLEDQGLLLLSADAARFCEAFQKSLAKHLQWWNISKDQVTNAQKSELSAMITSPYGILVPTKFLYTPTTKKELKKAIALYEFIKNKFTLSDTDKFAVDSMITFYNNAYNKIQDDTPPVPTTSSSLQEGDDTPKTQSAVGTGLPSAGIAQSLLDGIER
jgi:hypothetical protein